MRAALALVVVAGLAACTAVQQAADDAARGRAKRAVNAVVAQEFPGVDATPVTDCVIDNASAQEILQIAGSSATGATGEVTQMVLQIAQRRETVTCIAGQGVALALAG
ncbi:MAG: succinate dehydrogenase [Paracoccaceae bacterium]